MNLGIKERRRYRDISWLMPSVDVRGALERLGVERISVHGDEVEALCPDHHIFVCKESSHPKWTVNVDTGVTFCRTEGRSSNLVWTVVRMLECHPKQAVAFLTGIEGDVDLSALQLASIRGRLSNLRRNRDKPRLPVFGLDDIKRDMENRLTSEGMYQYFIKPPGKPETNIQAATVDHYKVFQRSWGYYSNRAIIPLELDGVLEGFCAIDILGERNWLIQHPLKDKDEYRKVLYPKNFRSGAFLFGYDDCEPGADYLILTEGAREVMKLWQEGFINSVALLGGNLSDEHILLISKLAPKVIVLLFDGDKAGYLFTDKAAKKLEKLFPVEQCMLPNGRDPKSYDAEGLKRQVKCLD